MKGFVRSAALLVAAGTAAAAMAERINLDFGNAFATPANTYGAAANQPGTWNQIAAQNTPNVLGINGVATDVSVAYNLAPVNFSFNNAGTAGDDQALLDDLWDLGTTGPDTITITGLDAGNYTIYTYAWAPDSAAFVTGVAVNGLNQQNVGGAWGGALQQGITHAVHNVAHAGGALTINLTPLNGGFGSLNGIQIVPEPASLSLLGLGAMGLIRRRR